MDIAEMNKEENTMSKPTITSVAANDVQAGLGKANKFDFSHSITIYISTKLPIKIMTTPKTSPVSSLKYL
jgi:hypothetical protein